MSEPEYTLSKKNVRRVGRAIRYVEAHARERDNLAPHARPGAGGQAHATETVIWPVKVTAVPPGASPGDGDLYVLSVGEVYLPDPDEDPPWRTLPCWVRPIPGHTLHVDNAGIARLTGWRPTGDGYDAMPVYTFVCCGGENPVVEITADEEDRPVVTWTLYQVAAGEEPDGTTPAVQYVLEYDEDGIVRQYQIYYPEGTDGNAPAQLQVAPDLWQWKWVFEADRPVFAQVVMPGAGQVQVQVIGDEAGGQGLFLIADVASGGALTALTHVFKLNGNVLLQVGNEAGTQYEQRQYTVDGSGNLTQVDRNLALWDGDSVVTKTVETTASANEIDVVVPSGVNYDFGGRVTVGGQFGAGDATFTGVVDLTAATVTGLNGPSWTLVDTITHADLTDADVQQDIDAYTIPAKTALLGWLIRTKTVGSGGGVAILTLTPYRSGSALSATPTDGLVANNIQGQGGLLTATTAPVASWTATSTFQVRFDSDVNLDTLTGGEWEVFLLLTSPVA